MAVTIIRIRTVCTFSLASIDKDELRHFTDTSKAPPTTTMAKAVAPTLHRLEVRSSDTTTACALACRPGCWG